MLTFSNKKYCLTTLMVTISLLTSCTILQSSQNSAITPNGSYVVVIKQSTFQKPEWQKVVKTLRKKYDAAVITYDKSVWDAKLALTKIMPRYTCFIAEHIDADRNFVVAIQRLTREYDADIYGDTLWAILTGYGASDALRIASQEQPLIVKRALSGTSNVNLNNYEEGIAFDEGKQGGRLIKQNGGKIVNETDFPADSTKGLVDAFNDFKPHLFYTSGHGFPGGWQIGYNYKDGNFISKDGKVFGIDTKNKRYEINSPNGKAYLPCGNCLVGLIKDKNSYSLAMMHSAGVNQMFGYVVVTFYGYMGWGIDKYFTGMKNHYSLSEAFFANQQALLYELNQEFPKLTAKKFKTFDQRTVCGIAQKAYPGNNKAMGMFWDRDAVAFYGDPAWQVTYPPNTDKSWNYTLKENHGLYELKITTTKDGEWQDRPLMFFLPNHINNTQILTGEEYAPVITDDFIMLPLHGKYKANDKFIITFKAKVANSAKTDAKMSIIKSKPSADSADNKAKNPLKNISLKLAKGYKNSVIQALRKSGKNSKELIVFLQKVKHDQLEDACFLVANMPDRDLESLSSQYLLENLQWSEKVRTSMPWSKNIPRNIYRNDILPYCVINERRDNWRQEFYKRFSPTIKDCKTGGEAACLLNQKMWEMIDVKYSTKRPKADQSPYESIDAKLASCTGLSVLLVDACRAVGIPARFAGVPSWTTKQGNHSWIEVWDDGWHLLGAFDGNKLDDSWFLADASKANDTKWYYQIYATSFKKTAIPFPCVWNLKLNYIPAIIRTKFYNGFAKKKSEKIRFLVQVYNKKGGERVAAKVSIMKNKKELASGISSSEIKDTNDILEFKLKAGEEVLVIIKYKDCEVRKKAVITKGKAQQRLDIFLQ